VPHSGREPAYGGGGARNHCCSLDQRFHNSAPDHSAKDGHYTANLGYCIAMDYARACDLDRCQDREAAAQVLPTVTGAWVGLDLKCTLERRRAMEEKTGSPRSC
jgi:hypothetical protein